MQSNAFSAGDLRVVDGDDVEYRGQRFRLAGFDTPQVDALRSNMDRSLEQQRGQMAKLHLQVLIAAARSVHLIDWEAPLKNGGRRLATLLLDGRDVRDIALAEGWGVDYRARKEVDWGDKALPFFGMQRIETA